MPKNKMQRYKANGEIFSSQLSVHSLDCHADKSVRNDAKGKNSSSFHHFISSQNCPAFTLAEVLITLGIIGVVAALTIPNLLQDSIDREAISRLKKAYSTLSSAYKLAEQSNDTPDQWGFTGYNSASDEIMINNLKPYLNVLKDCSVALTKGCFTPGIQYKYLDNTNTINYNDTGGSLLLADGTSIKGTVISAQCLSVMGSSTALKRTCAYILVDVNGFKGPNTVGKDFFYFYLTNYGIVPIGTQTDTFYPFVDGGCINTNGTYNIGVACTAWVLYNDNLDYVKCPKTLQNGWSGPTHCN